MFPCVFRGTWMPRHMHEGQKTAFRSQCLHSHWMSYWYWLQVAMLAQKHFHSLSKLLKWMDYTICKSSKVTTRNNNLAVFIRFMVTLGKVSCSPGCSPTHWPRISLNFWFSHLSLHPRCWDYKDMPPQGLIQFWEFHEWGKHSTAELPPQILGGCGSLNDSHRFLFVGRTVREGLGGVDLLQFRHSVSFRASHCSSTRLSPCSPPWRP